MWGDQQWILSFLEFWLPSGALCLAVLHDSLVAIPIQTSKKIRSFYHVLLSPFRNFLTINDIEETGPILVRVVWKTRALTLLSLVQLISWITHFCYVAVASEDARLIEQGALASVAWAYAFTKLILQPPITPPYALLLIGVSHTLVGIVEFGLDAWSHIPKPGVLVFGVIRATIPGLFVWLAGTLPLCARLPAANVAPPTEAPSALFSCPEDNVTLWSWSTFTFVEPILNLATTRTLNETDVWALSPFFKHRNIFRKCLQYRAVYPKHSLLHFLLVSNSLDLILDVALELWGAVVGYVPPYALKEILAALAENDPDSTSRAFYWALATFVAHLSFAQVDLFQGWHTRRCYERTRGQIFCTLHYKSLKRRDIYGQGKNGDNDKESADLGKIVNLMQGDAYAVAQRFWEFSGLFASPVRLAIALIFLHNVLGWSALSGVIIVLFAYMLNYPLARYNIFITRYSWKAKDHRMNEVNELLQNIRFLKFYGWENFWARKAQSARETELKWRVKENIISTLISFIWIWIPSATALISFLCYTLIAGQKLTVSKAFTSIALFAQLQEPMTALPGQVFAMLHAYVSMQRIEAFLGEDEVPDWASTLTANDINVSSGCIGFQEATLVWNSNSIGEDRFQLGPLDLMFPPGQLTLVTGATGSGKSALLVALLGEMRCMSGKIYLDKRNHQVAYCAQNPWLEHATIRDNVVFDSSEGYQEARYQSVIQACALKKDFEMLDARDMTEIGEKGITLSGGQRARIALARALYSQAKYILLDDPLAAVDMHTARHLVDNCLKGDLARGRTITLVTHHVSLCLPVASYLVELQKGAILRKGFVQEYDDYGVLGAVTGEEDNPFDKEAASPSTPENEADNLAKKDNEVNVMRHSGKLIVAEARAEGRVSFRTYWTYVQAAGVFCWILTLVLMLLIRFINIGNQVFLAKWGEAYQVEYSALTTYFTINGLPWDNLPSPDYNVKPWLMIYLYISLTGAFTVLVFIALGYYASLQASRSLFISLLQRLVRAPARFYDTTPIGRVLNRFTTDINTVDGALQNSARAALSGVLNFLASFTVIIVVVPNFTPFALIIAWLYIRLAPPYIQASRDLRRLESISLSPAFAGFDELLRGLVHVRAFGMEDRYQNGFYAKVDKFQAFDHVYWLVNGWLRWRYDCLGSVVVFATTLFALWSGVTDGSTAIVIIQAGIFAEASRQLVKVAAQLELDFNSVERIVEYLDVPQEAPAVIGNCRPPAYWPSSTGGLIVEDLTVQYAPDLPAVLHNLSLVINPSEKIGVVGRTGSGKSTFALSLLRMVEPSGGRIIIDNIDISSIGLEDLRTRITIVSQDVSLFSGTIRSNLDPLGEHTDQECWDVLERCHVTSLLTSGNSKLSLDMPINQGGSLSAGERQLVALARAVLRRSTIIILDEATSQIDSQLDDQIQKTIRQELLSSLVITIAHRLKTIIDYDRILVLDNGRILEFAPPRELLATDGSAFREMCRRSTDWPQLKSILNDGQVDT